MKEKSLIQSKAFWFAVLKFLAGALTAFAAAFGELLPASVAGVVLMITSLIDVYLRSITKTEITSVV